MNMPVIDDILEAVQKTFSFLPPYQKEKDYSAFLERQIEIHQQEYDFNFQRTKKGNFRPQQPYLWLMVDKLLLCAYLLGDRKIRESEYDLQKVFIITVDKLPLLRSRGDVTSLWPDSPLYSLYNRRERAHRVNNNFPKYRTILDEIGADALMVEKWGRALSYEHDLGGRKRRA